MAVGGARLLDRYLAVNVVGHSGGLVEAWNKTIFSKDDPWVGKYVAAVKLKRSDN